MQKETWLDKWVRSYTGDGEVPGVRSHVERISSCRNKASREHLLVDSKEDPTKDSELTEKEWPAESSVSTSAGTELEINEKVGHKNESNKVKVVKGHYIFTFRKLQQ